MPGGNPKPSVSFPISSFAFSLAFSCASLIAATIKSSTTSLSSLLKIEGSIFSAFKSPFADQVALTIPAPA